LTMTAQPRRTPRRRTNAEEEPLEPEPMEQEDSDDEPEQAETPSNSKTIKAGKPKKSSAAVETRRKTREELRSKNMGLGLKIDAAEVPTSRKITFNDAILEEIGQDPEENIEGEKSDEHEEDSDDDDDIEEVKGSSARQKALEQRSVERENSKVKQLEKKPKKKRSPKVSAEAKKAEDSDADDFDDEFFEQLDSEMATQRLEKQKLENLKPSGKHTAFVSADDDNTHEPIQVDHNIELVVLGHNEISSRSTDAKLGTAPSEAAIVFSRSKLFHGKDAKTTLSKKRQSNKTEVGAWTRSKKMNRIMFAGKRTAGQGRPAAHFVIHS
jgi:hypothetical protein